MSDQSPNNSTYSQTPATEVEEKPQPSSLRETIEAAYDEAPSPDAGQSDRQRDNLGRFAPKERSEPGVAEPRAPSPDKPIVEAQRRPEPAPEGSSTQPPEHWSAEFKADFTKLPPEGQAILLNRHREMEADYTRKLQATNGAVGIVQSLAPVFNDPVIAGSLMQEGMNAVEAIQQWGAFHKQALSHDVRDRINLLVDLSQRMGLDPARLFATPSQQPPPQIPQEDWNDPAVRYFADHLGRTTSDLQALRGELQAMRQAEARQREQETVEQTRWGIDTFADEKAANGAPLRPYFDAVLPQIIELFQANPDRDLNEAYEFAVWANPETRRHMLAAQNQHAQNANAAERARLAVRGNTRGMTSPVSKPNAKTGNGSLRDLIEASADEVGL